jgi:hypothetical protein
LEILLNLRYLQHQIRHQKKELERLLLLKKKFRRQQNQLDLHLQHQLRRLLLLLKQEIRAKVEKLNFENHQLRHHL